MMQEQNVYRWTQDTLEVWLKPPRTRREGRKWRKPRTSLRVQTQHWSGEEGDVGFLGSRRFLNAIRHMPPHHLLTFLMPAVESVQEFRNFYQPTLKIDWTSSQSLSSTTLWGGYWSKPCMVREWRNELEKEENNKRDQIWRSWRFEYYNWRGPWYLIMSDMLQFLLKLISYIDHSYFIYLN